MLFAFMHNLNLQYKLTQKKNTNKKDVEKAVFLFVLKIKISLIRVTFQQQQRINLQNGS